jgi:hypothetical protein
MAAAAAAEGEGEGEGEERRINRPAVAICGTGLPWEMG